MGSARQSLWDAAGSDLLSCTLRQQVDEEPPIRANTTILLGNLAAHLGEATQKRVLLNAFTRSLKDGFPPARIAGLKVCYTSTFFAQNLDCLAHSTVCASCFHHAQSAASTHLGAACA
jgi:hypothetical protein